MSPAVSLNKAKESMLFQLDLEQSKNRYQQFTFSKHFTRIALSSGLEQKAPSILATALNVTKIAPVIFFAIEKFTKATETLFNAGLFLVNSAYGALFGSRETAVLNLHKELEQTLEKSTNGIDGISFEDPIHVSVNSLEEVIFAGDKPLTETNAANGSIQGTVLQNLLSSETASPADNIAIQFSSPIAVANDDLGGQNDLANAGPALLPAPAHKTRNALIGGGLVALASAVTYGAAYYFNMLPDSLNFIGSNQDQEPVDETIESQEKALDIKPLTRNVLSSEECNQDTNSPDLTVLNSQSDGYEENIELLDDDVENPELSDDTEESFDLNNVLIGAGAFSTLAVLGGAAKRYNLLSGSINPFGKKSEEDSKDFQSIDADSKDPSLRQSIGSGISYLCSVPGRVLFRKTEEHESIGSEPIIDTQDQPMLQNEDTDQDPSQSSISKDVSEFQDVGKPNEAADLNLHDMANKPSEDARVAPPEQQLSRLGSLWNSFWPNQDPIPLDDPKETTPKRSPDDQSFMVQKLNGKNTYIDEGKVVYVSE